MICNHRLVTVGKRRWCTRQYTDGGCGAHWVLRGWRWVLVEKPTDEDRDLMARFARLTDTPQKRSEYFGRICDRVARGAA